MGVRAYKEYTCGNRKHKSPEAWLPNSIQSHVHCPDRGFVCYWRWAWWGQNGEEWGRFIAEKAMCKNICKIGIKKDAKWVGKLKPLPSFLLVKIELQLVILFRHKVYWIPQITFTVFEISDWTNLRCRIKNPFKNWRGFTPRFWHYHLLESFSLIPWSF